ncbi:hypothetical protein BH23ACT5_BH23ACT5_14090 [soil metagenome]
MTGWRAGLAAAVVIALAVTVWAAVSPDDQPVPTTFAPPSTVPPTSTTTTPTTPTVPTTTTDTPVTATVVPDTTFDADARTEEVRLILEDLWFRWFDAIYHDDEEAVREVVSTQRGLDDFAQAVAQMDLPRKPQRGDVRVQAVEVLRDDDDCLVVFHDLDLTEWRGPDSQSSLVDVLFPYESGWRFATTWQNRNDLWEADCEAERSDELP